MRHLFRLLPLLFLLQLTQRTLSQQQPQCACLSASGCTTPLGDNNAVVGGNCWALIDGILQPQVCASDCCIFCFDEEVIGGEGSCVGFNGGFCRGEAGDLDGNTMDVAQQTNEQDDGTQQQQPGMGQEVVQQSPQVQESPQVQDQTQDEQDSPLPPPPQQQQPSPPPPQQQAPQGLEQPPSSSPPPQQQQQPPQGGEDQQQAPTPPPQQPPPQPSQSPPPPPPPPPPPSPSSVPIAQEEVTPLMPPTDTNDNNIAEASTAPVTISVTPEVVNVAPVTATASVTPEVVSVAPVTASVTFTPEVVSVAPVTVSVTPEVVNVPVGQQQQQDEEVDQVVVVPPSASVVVEESEDDGTSPPPPPPAGMAASPSASASVSAGSGESEEDGVSAVVGVGNEDGNEGSSGDEESGAGEGSSEETGEGGESSGGSSESEESSASEEDVSIVAATVEPTPAMTKPSTNGSSGNSSEEEMEAYQLDLKIVAPMGLSAGLNTAIEEVEADMTGTETSGWALTEIKESEEDTRAGTKQVEAKYVAVFEPGAKGMEKMTTLAEGISDGSMQRELRGKGFDGVEISVEGEPSRLRVEGGDSSGSSEDPNNVEEASKSKTPVIVGSVLGSLAGVGVLAVLGVMFWNSGRGGLNSRFASTRSNRSSRRVNESDFDDLEDGSFGDIGHYADGGEYGGPGRRETEMTSKTYNVSDVNGEVGRRGVPRGPTVLMRESSIMEWQENTSMQVDGNVGGDGNNNVGNGGSSGRIEQLRRLTESPRSTGINVTSSKSIESTSSASSSYSGIKALDPEEDDLYLGGADGDVGR